MIFFLDWLCINWVDCLYDVIKSSTIAKSCGPCSLLNLLWIQLYLQALKSGEYNNYSIWSLQCGTAVISISTSTSNFK